MPKTAVYSLSRLIDAENGDYSLSRLLITENG
jgi:hypothetical protein